MIFIDRETGESLEDSFCDKPLQTPKLNVNNAETGEPEIIYMRSFKRRVPFQIPKKFKKQFSLNEDEKLINKKHRNIIPFTEGTCFGQINPIFLFLPAIFYFRWFAAILVLFEVILHRWTHHKNKYLKNVDIYYRSPFYGITSEFCALCQHEARMNRVGKMQEIRMHKFLRQCHYMKRAVT